MKTMTNTKRWFTLLLAVLIFAVSWSGCKRAPTENPVGDRIESSYSEQDLSSTVPPEVVPSSMPSVLISNSNVQEETPSQMTTSVVVNASEESSSLSSREPSPMEDVSSYVLEHGYPSSQPIVSPPPSYRQTYRTSREEEFLAWAKSDGGDWVNEYNQAFLDWVSVNKRLLLPKMKRDDILELEIRSQAQSRAGYVYRYDTEGGYTFDAVVIPISEEEKDFGVFAQFLPMNLFESMKKSSEPCPWGEYWYADPVFGEDGRTEVIPSAVFFVQDYAVVIQALQKAILLPWNDEYFTYFDFETVSW